MTDTSLLTKLQRKTAGVLAARRRRVRKSEQAKQQAESKRLRGEPARARKIIAGIYDLAAEEAKHGSTQAMIMKLRLHQDYSIPRDDEEQHPSVLRPEMLKGAAKIVYEYCLRQKLTVTLEWWNSEICLGMGIEWTESKPIKRPVKKTAVKKPAKKTVAQKAGRKKLAA